MQFRANGKVNLILNVYGQNGNGYHNVEMIMAPIILFDIINIEFNNSLVVNTPGVSQEDNLITKMVNLIEQTYDLEIKLLIDVEKHLPTGGGVAGGSSDAVCVLKAINLLYDLNLTREEMLHLSAQIGSDCPFFVDNCISLVTGQGEEVLSLDYEINKELILVNPGINVSTKAVFDNYTNTNNHGDISQFLNSNNINYLHNDLTASCCGLYPKVKSLLEELDNYHHPSLLSGSGSSCFMIVDNKLEAEELRQQLASKYPLVYHTQVVSRIEEEYEYFN